MFPAIKWPGCHGQVEHLHLELDHPHLVLRLRMSEVRPVLLQYAFKAWTWTTLPYFYFYLFSEKC